MNIFFIRTAAVLGAISVATGAFAAHTLKSIVTADVLQIFETAVKYQFYHVFALLATGMLYKQYAAKKLLWAGWLFIAGIVLFCGSLYLLCLLKHLYPADRSWVGAITPLGGLCFIAGWLLLAAGLRTKPLL
jgi:uncharacterized membrane protein YgdD (TMEM256/DUF423 family)